MKDLRGGCRGGGGGGGRRRGEEGEGGWLGLSGSLIGSFVSVTCFKSPTQRLTNQTGHVTEPALHLSQGCPTFTS